VEAWHGTAGRRRWEVLRRRSVGEVVDTPCECDGGGDERDTRTLVGVEASFRWYSRNQEVSVLVLREVALASLDTCMDEGAVVHDVAVASPCFDCCQLILTAVFLLWWKWWWRRQQLLVLEF
jgi:hypothetical protein